MYGYRQPNENGLMTNLNSISSSLSSIDTIGRRNNSSKASADNLITLRSQSITSTSLLWNRNNKDNERYSTATSVRNVGPRCQGSEIYYNGGGARTIIRYCPTPEAALHFLIVPLLLLTVIRQVFDFLGQIWLQILINFFTILLIIVALFGIRQSRISYLNVFILWALLNTVWNLFVVCIHTKIRDVGVNEDFLSLYTGTTSWWHTNGPGCLPYNISSIQPSISILKPNIITGCRLDYHLVEATQAALHASISFLASLFCCCVVSAIRRNPSYFIRKQPKTDKLYRLNNLTNDRSKINHDPFPNHNAPRFGPGSASLRRAANKTSSRSSQHSVSSVRSRRRNRQSTDGVAPTPRGSTSSAQRSQKYGSLSSRRSHKKDRRGDISSLTYGTTSGRVGANQRTRLSSLSSTDYLPSYQPPHSSSANLLSSYGEISSIDSYNNSNSNNNNNNSARNGKYRQAKTINGGNSNPTYTGSRSSVCSQNANNANNYDDLSYIYGNNNSKAGGESLYGVSTSAAMSQSRLRQQQQIYQRDRTDGNDFDSRNQQQQHVSMPQEIKVETYQMNKNFQPNADSTLTRPKVPIANGGSFQSFSTSGQQNLTRSKLKESVEVNNNNTTSNYHQDAFENQPKKGAPDPRQSLNTFDNRSRVITSGSMNVNSASNQLYSNQHNLRRPIYSNQLANGNSETPI